MGGSGTKAGTAIVGVAAVGGQGRFVGEVGDDLGVGHGVGLADAKIEEFLIWVGSAGGAFGALNSLEFIDRGCFEAVAWTADSLSEEVVEVGRHFVGLRCVKIITKTAEMQKASRAWRRRGQTVALVPTMGALHNGHVALIRRAGKLADRVVVSAYVNPTQFTSRVDYRQYPERGAADVQRAKEAGADVLFRPKSLYAKDASTWVEEIDRSRGRCGARRPGHFRGVATVVMKLFGIVQPQVAVFGEKDKQQCEVIERMVRDLFCAVRIVQLPTIREKDGLPMSSRNLRLSPLERGVAGRWAKAVREASQAGASRSVAKLKLLLRGLPGLRLEYAEVVEGQLYSAVYLGKIRLIDHRPFRRKS